MNFKEYEEAVERTRNTTLTAKETACNWAMGLAGETGEVVDIVKKAMFHGARMDFVHLEEEIGDVMYYLQALATFWGLTLDEAMAKNVVKLEKRYPNGFVEGGGIRRNNNDHEDDAN